MTFTVLNWGKDRATVVKTFVKIARHLHKVHNYNCCAAVITGLRSLPLSRLKNLLPVRLHYCSAAAQWY